MKTMSIKNRIMFGVYIIYFFRKIRSPLVVEIAPLFLGAVLLFVFVSIPSVISNMYDSGQFGSYLLMAFSHTEHIGQAMLVLVGVAGLVLLRRVIPRGFLKPQYSL